MHLEPWLLRLCAMTMFVSGGWLAMVALVAGAALLVSMFGGDVVALLLGAPAAVFLVSFGIGLLAAIRDERPKGGGDAR